MKNSTFLVWMLAYSVMLSTCTTATTALSRASGASMDVALMRTGMRDLERKIDALQEELDAQTDRHPAD